MNKIELWHRIWRYTFSHIVPQNLWEIVRQKFGGDDAPLKAFASKLASKRGWSKEFALRAISEYKKFVYLGVTSRFSVTPSRIIDQVWHQHLQFTGPYREFCAEVIEYNFDHNPELIPVSEETAVFSKQYESTLELYRKEFGVEPPADIWGKPKFDPKKVKKNAVAATRESTSGVSDSGTSDLPLYMLISSESESSSSGFQGGGGGFGGGGASGAWETSQPSTEVSSPESSGGSSGHDGGDSGGSSCSSGDGGSSCSSGCGGGGD